MFLEKAYEGKNDIGRWIAMIVILLIVSQFVGGIPLGIMIFLKMSDNPEESASRIVIEADYGRKKDLMRNIKEFGKSKGFLVINEV